MMFTLLLLILVTTSSTINTTVDLSYEAGEGAAS